MPPFDPTKRHKITLTPPIFPDHTQPKGHLSSDMRSQACWYFYLMAQKQLERVGGIMDEKETQFGLLDIYPWQKTHYQQLAKTVAFLYQLESPSEFAKAWSEVEREAAASGLPAPREEYKRVAPMILLS
jgi:hypothetical protein